MTSQHLNRILCIGQPGDSSDDAERILEAASGAGAEVIALVGDLARDLEGYRDLFRTLARAPQPVYWVPGAGDAPVDHYLKASYDIEVAFPTVRGLHGTAHSRRTPRWCSRAWAARSATTPTTRARSSPVCATRAGKRRTG